MKVDYLDVLDWAVGSLLQQETVREDIARLELALKISPEPFVWSVVDCSRLGGVLPQEIRSAWIFVLRKGLWTGAHYHPNSIQHMAVVEGGGWARVAGKLRSLVPHGTSGYAYEDVWQVIDKEVPHEFLPEGRDMVVISFHTCAADELVEIEVGSGHTRRYEPGKLNA